MYGIFVYSFQGQFTLGIAYQGVSKYSWQTVNNVFGLITGIIAAGLYGNIGISASFFKRSFAFSVLPFPPCRGCVLYNCRTVVQGPETDDPARSLPLELYVLSTQGDVFHDSSLIGLFSPCHYLLGPCFHRWICHSSSANHLWTCRRDLHHAVHVHIPPAPHRWLLLAA